ncbi:MAG TPA: ABC transporter permease [Eubacteriaceae bacterium]|nr:ABC transporter permease [Eubacteriaceae bacterium]
MKKFRPIDNLRPVLTLVLLIALWQMIVVLLQVPAYILPTPEDIAQAFVEEFGALIYHGQITLYQSLVGFFWAILLAFVLAVLMDVFYGLKKSIYPLLVVSQTVPIIAIAPLLIIWFGFGTLPKIIIVIIMCFFPIAINLVHGFESIDEDYINLFRSMDATKLQTMIHLKIPFSMVHFFSGLKIAATYMIMSAVIGEWLGGSRGIGVYMLRAKNAYALDRVFASIIFIVLISILFIYLIDFISTKILHWQTERNEWV